MARVTEAHIEARRNQILEAAWQCFAHKGYHQTTMQDIATEAGLSAGAIYRYFPSKEGVLRAINDRSQELGRALVEEARSRAGEPLDILLVIGQTWFSEFNDPMFETTARVDIEIWPEIIRNEGLRRNVRRELTFWRKVVTQLLSEARGQGRLREEVDPEAAAILFMCAWQGLRSLRLVDSDSFTPERVIDALRVLLPADLAIEPDRFAHEPVILSPPLGTPTVRRRRSRKKGAADVAVDS
jgi:AcrR family transcriptional regulator